MGRNVVFMQILFQWWKGLIYLVLRDPQDLQERNRVSTLQILASIVHLVTKFWRGFFYPMKNEMAKILLFRNGKIFSISNGKNFSHFKWQKIFFHFHISSFIAHKNDLFSWPECISLIQEPNWTSFFLHLCKVHEIFENFKNIFAIWNGKNFAILK